MSTSFQQPIEPLQLARSGRHMNGQGPIAGMTRLECSLYDTSGKVEYDLQFGVDSTGQAYITGLVKAELSLLCQRCMEKVLTKVESSVTLGVVTSYEEAERLLEKYDPLVVEDSQIKFGDIIEDELLLALPLIVMHSDEECNINKGYSVDATTSQELQDEKNDGRTLNGPMTRQNPFSILEKLKSD